MVMKSYTNLWVDPGDSLKNFDVIGEAEPKSFMNVNEYKKMIENLRPNFREQHNQLKRPSFIEYCHKFRYGPSLETMSRTDVFPIMQRCHDI